MRSFAMTEFLLIFSLFMATSPRTTPKPCDDQIPKSCRTAQFIGEQDGCSCWLCNPGKEDQAVICTRDETKKTLLRNKVEQQRKD
jgi:hypothetical protein